MYNTPELVGVWYLEITDAQNTPDGWVGNYSWVHRYYLPAGDLTWLQALRRLRKMSGFKGHWRMMWNQGDDAAYRLDGCAIVQFFGWTEIPRDDLNEYLDKQEASA